MPVKKKSNTDKMKKPKSKSHCLNMSASRKGIANPPESYLKASLTRQNKSETLKEKQFQNLSRCRKGIATVYDLDTHTVVKIPKERFNELRNIKYVGLNSKLINK